MRACNFKIKLKLICLKTREIIGKVVKKNLADGLLFSGGIDTSVIAYEASKHKRITAITIAFKEGTPEDLEYAKKAAAFMGIKHEIYVFDVDEMLKAAEKAISILKVFDPMEVRNSIPVYIGLKNAKDIGLKEVMTGDGLDELFLGYPWLFHLPEDKLKEKLTKMWGTMRFSSIPLGSAIGVSVKTPFLHPEYMEFAKKIDIKLKLNVKDEQKYGKWLIRKAYEGLIPDLIIWRSKAPLEIGTGTQFFQDFSRKKSKTAILRIERKSTWRKMKFNSSLRNSCSITRYLEGFVGNPAKSTALKLENNVRTVKPSWAPRRIFAECAEPTRYKLKS